MEVFGFFELTEREIDKSPTGASRSPNPDRREDGKSEIDDFSDHNFSNLWLVKQKSPVVTSTMNS